jgi:hypothetical protein
MNFSGIYSEIIQNRENHQQGYFNCIPFMGMERLERYLPGIELSTYYLLGASSGIGKSKLLRYLFIHNPLMYIENNPEEDIKVDILYFSLEESKEKIIKGEICKYLFTKYGLSISIKQLSSVGRFNTIDTDTLLKIKEAEEHVNNFLSKVKIFDTIRNPTGIYKQVRDFALTVGTYYDKNNNSLTPREVENVKLSIGEDYKKISYYKKHHPKHYVLVLIDHLSLLSTEVGETLWQTMGRMSSKYCLHFRDKFGFIPVVVQQFSADKERIETNFKGKTIEEKLEPSTEGFGDNKTTIRDANIVLGLFGPDRYKITEHDGYDITFFRDRYRSLSILKSRDGVANKKLPLFFNGAVDFFKELPKTDDVEGMRRVYEYINELNRLN